MTTPEIVKIQSKWLKDAIKRIRELESENKDFKNASSRPSGRTDYF